MLNSTAAIQMQDQLLSDAYIRGRMAGNQMLSPACNPFGIDDARHEQWRQGFNSALEQQTTEDPE